MSCKCYHADKNFLGEIGVCWGTKEREACSCNGDEAKCDFYDYVRKRAKKAITNADRIRGMANEELAEFFGTLPCCPPGTDLNELCYPNDSCNGTDLQVKCWLEWLKQEVQE